MKVANNSAASKRGKHLTQGQRNGLMQPREKNMKASPSERQIRRIKLAVLLQSQLGKI